MSRPRRGLVPLLLFLGTVALYANSAGNGFVHDDTPLVRDNPLIRDLRELPTLFTSDYWEPTARVGLYRPLVTASFALDFALGGGNPRGYHLVNILLHGLVSVGVWLLFRRLHPERIVALGAAALFAAHAVHTEVVANIAGRSELLWALFFLLALLAYLKAGERSGGRALGYYSASLLAYLLAMLSKESAVTLVGVLFCYDLAYRSDGGGSLSRRAWTTLLRGWRVYAAYSLAALLYLSIRYLALGPSDLLPVLTPVDNPLAALAPPWRILSALEVALRYLWLQAFPLNLSYDYSFNAIPTLTSLADPRAWAVIFAGVLALSLVPRSHRLSRAAFFAIAFYGVTFLPVSNLIVPIGTIMADRLTYVPSLGFCLGGVLAVRWALTFLRLDAAATRRVFIGVLSILVLAHAGRAFVRNADWESEERLYLHDLTTVPTSIKALTNAGAMLQNLGEHPQAIELFQRALALDPSYRDASINWAFSLSALGRRAEAIIMLERQLEEEAPDPAVLNNLGFLLIESGIDPVRGVELVEKAVAARPQDADYLDSLGWGYHKLGRSSEGRELLLRSLEIDAWSSTTPARRAHLEEIERSLVRVR